MTDFLENNPYPISNPLILLGKVWLKYIATQRCITCICFYTLDFPENTLGYVPKNGVYFCSARHISSHNGICQLKLPLVMTWRYSPRRFCFYTMKNYWNYYQKISFCTVDLRYFGKIPEIQLIYFQIISNDHRKLCFGSSQ